MNNLNSVIVKNKRKYHNSLESIALPIVMNLIVMQAKQYQKILKGFIASIIVILTDYSSLGLFEGVLVCRYKYAHKEKLYMNKGNQIVNIPSINWPMMGQLMRIKIFINYKSETPSPIVMMVFHLE